LTHGETLNLDGNFSQENIKQMGCKDMAHFQETLYYYKGAEAEEYCPMFSIHGFRYVLLEGYEEKQMQTGDFQAVAVYSAMEETGDFTCSNPLINQLVKNSRWSQKGNFMEVAVDCPTRERNAWTGDNQIYAMTATRFMNVYPFYEKWLQDQAIEQYASGKVSISFPCTTSVHRPETLEEFKADNPLAALAGPTGDGSVGEDCAGWGDAAAYLPYIMYLTYGDRQILENQYETARKWVDYMLACAKEHNDFYQETPQYQTLGEDGILDAEFIYDTRMHYGEWQEPLQNHGEIHVTPEVVARMMKMGKPKVATAYMSRSAGNVADMAEVLGKTEDAKYYKKIAERIRSVYETYLIEDDGIIEPGHQAAYVRALTMDLCTGKKKEMVAEHLVKEVTENEYRLNTGFLSTPFLLPSLVEIGRADLAFRLLEQTEAPSWLHPVLLGATTIPEGWYSFDRFTDSHNHYSFGAVCDFLFGYVAGIRPLWEKPGYEEFLLEPVFGGSLTEAKAEYEGLYGRITSEWKLEDDEFIYNCSVPVNTKAKIIMPDKSQYEVGSGSYTFSCKV
ncbi:MAG: family 78 glycoside hydrolase catalytic domain, partial [Lachnospiraceae bacterium]|nr:family 78 glycoside hydrolase catalytic domain [Lachnospiraceae bacterium]